MIKYVLYLPQLLMSYWNCYCYYAFVLLLSNINMICTFKSSKYQRADPSGLAV
jgi:hypothetical protein